MKKIIVLALIVITTTLSSCFSNYLDYSIQSEPNVPDSYNGYPVNVQGTIYVDTKYVTFYVWDSEEVDGDIISLIVNGDVILDNYTLTATEKAISVTLDNTGYNYVILYAHNVGSLPPNTCALDIEDDGGRQSIILSADLSTNGAYNIYVE